MSQSLTGAIKVFHRCYKVSSRCYKVSHRCYKVSHGYYERPSFEYILYTKLVLAYHVSISSVSYISKTLEIIYMVSSCL